jgi:hypothetical protein
MGEGVYCRNAIARPNVRPCTDMVTHIDIRNVKEAGNKDKGEEGE